MFEMTRWWLDFSPSFRTLRWHRESKQERDEWRNLIQVSKKSHYLAGIKALSFPHLSSVPVQARKDNKGIPLSYQTLPF